MRVIVYLMASCLHALAVINNGFIIWTPNGAVSYSIWRANPGTTTPMLEAVVSVSPYAIPNPVADGTLWWLKGNYPLESGQCCKESDLAFIVTPPTTNITGTNFVRIVGPVNALMLQSSEHAGAPWSNMVLFTGGPPVQLPLAKTGVFRTSRTNLPPFPQ